MDIAVDKSKSDGKDGNRPGPFLAVSQTVREIVSRLIGFFELTEADKLKAGIHPGGEERDE